MADSIFPFVDLPPDTGQTQTKDLPLAREYAWDFDNNCLKIVGGKTEIVEENEAIKVWAWKALNTERYRYLGYTWDFGCEIENLLGHGYSHEVLTAEVKRYILEALTANPYILSIINVDLTVDGSSLSVTFTALTIYGEVQISV